MGTRQCTGKPFKCALYLQQTFYLVQRRVGDSGCFVGFNLDESLSGEYAQRFTQRGAADTECLGGFSLWDGSTGIKFFQ